MKDHVDTQADAGDLLSAIIDSSEDAIISKDLHGTITSWNKGAERIFGYTADEAIGGPISILIPPDKGAEELDILQRISRGERLGHYETFRVRKDGHRIEVSVTISPLRQGSRIVGASKIARDITDQKRIEREVQTERARLQVTLKSIGDAVIVTDANGSVEFMNPVAEALTGWKSADAHGQALEAVFNIVNEKTRRRVANPAARALQEGVTVGLANHTILISKTGAEFAIDDSASPIRTDGEEVLGAILVFRDVSAHRSGEDFRARLAAIIQSSDDAIVSKDLNGRIMSWNPGAVRLFGYTAEEAIGRPISIIIPPERLIEEAHILDRMRRGERIDHFETIRLRKDRRKVEISLTVSPLFDSDGNVIGASKIARDVTEHRRLQRELTTARERLQKYAEELEQTVQDRTSELHAAYRELEAFTYSVAHDLRAPLRRMEGYLATLKLDLGPKLPPDPGDLLDRTMLCVQRTDRLVSDLLTLSQAGKQTPRFQKTALSDVLQLALADLKSETENRRIEWRIGSLPVVHGDPNLLRQMFVNLLSNAVKYTRRRPLAVIEVNQTLVQDTLTVYVRDNGIGFDPHQVSKLFTPFQRLHSEADFAGSGIGLVIVERIVRRHGGRVWADAALDGGATFYFTLPSGARAEDPNPPAPSEPVQPTP